MAQVKRQPVVAEPVFLPDPKRKDGRGRERALTNDVATNMLWALQHGAYRSQAARFAGVAPEQFSQWMGYKGEPYETFQKMVEQAEAGLEVVVGASIVNKLDNNPFLALDFMGRRWPERWGKVNAAPSLPPGAMNLTFNLADVLDEIARRRGQVALPKGGKVIDVPSGATGKKEEKVFPRDPRGPRPRKEQNV